jgi:mRNA-degrading endonuclease RelE of RelBE toxin-antitoxin system
MNTIEIRERLNEKLDNLSTQELSSVLDFVQSLEKDKIAEETNIPKDELLERWKKLFKETQELFKDDPITDEEIAAEIDAYREGR